ncbi:hypothetical protein ES707_11147 [subsurface metagenome]
MKHFEHRIVTFEHTGALAAGNVWSPPVHEVDVDEMGEIVFAEVDPPVTGGGAEEVINRWYPVLDGSNYDDYLALNGTHSPLMNPPQINTLGNIVAFGTPLATAIDKAFPMLENTCPKFKKSVGVRAWAGAGGITADFRIRLHIYVYRKDELPHIAASVPGVPSLFDKARNRSIPVNKGAVVLTYDNWDNLPGGLDQTLPSIHPYWRWSENHAATTPNSDYSFRTVLGNVDPTEAWKELYWNFEEGEHILIVRGLGVRADPAGHLMDTALKIAGDYHPRYRIPTAMDGVGGNPLANAIHFGHMYPFDALTSYYFAPIPKFDRPYIIYDEIGEVIIRDDGIAVVADHVKLALNGVLIELV